MLVLAAVLVASILGNVALAVNRRKLRRRPYFLALAIHDRVVQSLTAARMSFENEDSVAGFECIDLALTASKQIISETINDSGGIVPGSLSKMRERDA